MHSPALHHGDDTAKSVSSLSRGRVPDSSPWILFLFIIYNYKPIGPSALNDSCHEVFFCHFTMLGSFFLNRTLLGGVELLRSESGSFFCHFTKLVTCY